MNESKPDACRQKKEAGGLLLIGVAMIFGLSACADSYSADLVTDMTDQQALAVKSEISFWKTIYPGGTTACSDGSDYAFHVKSGDPDKVFVFLNGGGACWDARTCDTREGKQTFVPRADSPHNHPSNHGGIFDLTRADNPVKDWTMVFVPYCTGDVHLGSRDATYRAADGQAFTVKHRGAANTRSVLSWINGKYAPQRIVVSGASAGALSAPVYAEAMRERYPAADILQFSGGASGYGSPAAHAILKQWRAFDALPKDRLSAVNQDTAGFYSFFLPSRNDTRPIRRAIYDSSDDKVQVMFRRLTGVQGSLSDSHRETYREIRQAAGPTSTFLAAGNDHTVLRFDYLYTRKVGETSFRTWFEALLAGQTPADVDCADELGGCISSE